MKIKLTHSEAMEKIKELQSMKKGDYDLPEFLKGFMKWNTETNTLAKL